MTRLDRPSVFDTTLRFRRIVGTALLAVCCVASNAYGGHPHGDADGARYPHGIDPSALTDLVIDTDDDLLEGLPEANEGTFEGGKTGHTEDASDHNVLRAEDQRDDGRFNVPTNGPPSPLYGAQPFSQQMLRFEEFGTEKLKFKKKKPKKWKELPEPADAQSAPDGGKLEGFLSQRIWPNPTKFANTEDQNPWQDVIGGYLGRELDDPPAEGRPPGLGWSHQRWHEFKPEIYFQTAMAGARTNGGFRNSNQGHKYKKGEFGKKGLYHNTVSKHPVSG